MNNSKTYILLSVLDWLTRFAKRFWTGSPQGLRATEPPKALAKTRTRLAGVLVGIVLLTISLFVGVTAYARDARDVRLPGARTTEAAGVEGSAVLLRGVIYPRGRHTVWRFQWGRTTRYGQIAYKYPPEEGYSDRRPHEVEEVVECLSPHTLYHFRVVAYSGGRMAFGQDETFRTVGLRFGRKAAYGRCPGQKPVR